MRRYNTSYDGSLSKTQLLCLEIFATETPVLQVSLLPSKFTKVKLIIAKNSSSANRVTVFT